MEVRRRLPPLNALRAFEAAGRRNGYARAADELNVTPAAVAQQVRKLEDYIGLPLFDPQGPDKKLTAEGKALLACLTRGFDQLQKAVNHLHASRGIPRVVATICTSFTSKWLLKRVPDFYARHPSIDLHLVPSMHLPDFRSGSVDLAIHYSRGNYSGIEAHYLFNEVVFPVCAPGYFGQRADLSIAGLKEALLLNDGALIEGATLPRWSDWFDAIGLMPPERLRGPTIGPSHAVIQAACDGWGVALGRSVLVEDDLERGSLVRPFSHFVATGHAYYMVMPLQEPAEPVRLFRDWLLKHTQSRARTKESHSLPAPHSA